MDSLFCAGTSSDSSTVCRRDRLPVRAASAPPSQAGELHYVGLSPASLLCRTELLVDSRQHRTGLVSFLLLFTKKLPTYLKKADVNERQ